MWWIFSFRSPMSVRFHLPMFIILPACNSILLLFLTRTLYELSVYVPHSNYFPIRSIIHLEPFFFVKCVRHSMEKSVPIARWPTKYTHHQNSTYWKNFNAGRYISEHSFDLFRVLFHRLYMDSCYMPKINVFLISFIFGNLSFPATYSFQQSSYGKCF